ncbi:MAG: HIRAN domain-containing protein [Paludibacteraceae bacterium]|nr:HIRAN domain-containing protein [Paludibacteraceae bacterium]
MNKGKAICEILKQLRIDIAKANNIEYHPTKCTHEGPCVGTCPMCEEELNYLNMVIEHRRLAGIEMNYETCAKLEDIATLMAQCDPEEEEPKTHRLMGEVPYPDDIILAGIPAPPIEDDDDPIDEPLREKTKSVRKRKVVTDNDIKLAHIVVAGTTHSERFDEVAEEIEKGMKMIMKRHHRNQYDKNAIGVYYRNIRIGWVPKSDNEVLARLMDGDRRLYFLTTSIEKQNNWTKIEGDVYMIK